MKLGLDCKIFNNVVEYKQQIWNLDIFSPYCHIVILNHWDWEIKPYKKAFDNHKPPI